MSKLQVFGLVLLSSFGAGAFEVAVRGKAADVTVVVPDKAAPSQAFAAQEFVKYVAKMTGVTLPVAPSATNRAVRLVLDESMPGDDFTIVSTEREVVVRGGVRGWAAQTDRLYVWDYVTAFQHYLLPFPDVKVMQQNLKLRGRHL